MDYKLVDPGNGNEEYIDIQAVPSVIRRGIFYLNMKEEKDPLYIIELQENEGSSADVVSVYDVKNGSNPPIKDYTETVISYKYGDTALGNLANEAHKERLKKTRTKTEEKPPLFLAPVTIATNTMTGRMERGFFERKPDSFYKNEEGKPAIRYGENSGVFIGLSIIKWEQVYYSVEELIDQFVQDKMIWFGMNDENGFTPFESDKQSQIVQGGM